MATYHRKHEITPIDKKDGAKLLSQENTLHKQKGLSKDIKHVPHRKPSTR